MLDHFARLTAPYAARLDGPVESLVYHALPADRLVVRDEVSALVVRAAHKQGEPLPAPRAVDAALAALADRGFVRRVGGARVDRLVSGL